MKHPGLPYTSLGPVPNMNPAVRRIEGAVAFGDMYIIKWEGVGRAKYLDVPDTLPGSALVEEMIAAAAANPNNTKNGFGSLVIS